MGPAVTSRAAAFLALLPLSCSFLDPQVGPLQTCSQGGAPLDAGYGIYGGGSVIDAAAYTTSTSPAIYGAVTGHLLITDQYNNRVIEVTRDGAIVWSFGDGSSVPGPTSVVAPNDAERLPGGRTLIAGTGGPPKADVACPSAGCPDNRVIIVDDATGAIVWQYGAYGGVAGKGPDQLSYPVAAVLVPTKGGEDILITDQGNNRVIEVYEADKMMEWSFPPEGSTETLTSPNSAERLTNDDTLISDLGGNRVIEVDVGGNVKWQYPSHVDPKVLSSPSFASRLANGHTLITDTGNNRIIEVDSATPPGVVWTYSTADRNPCNPSPQPTGAVRLKNGHTLITDQFNDQVLEVGGSPPMLLYTYGKLGIAGSAVGLLWAPYDAKVIGDFTGLTSP
jgi:hypothetical protein